MYAVTLPLPLNTLEQAMKILGRLQERRRPLGKLNWTPITTTATIAWNTPPLPSFGKLGRREASPNNPEDDGQTLLSFAAKNGLVRAMELLFEQEGVSSDKPDRWGQTAPADAAWNRHEVVVKILLGREEANPDKPDNDGQTPLWQATERGHERVVALLQPRKAVTP